MKTVILYESILGSRFNTMEEAIAHEDQIPLSIALWEKDLPDLVEGGNFAGRILSKEEAARLYPQWVERIEDWKAKWAEVQKQRIEDEKYYKEFQEWMEKNGLEEEE